MLGAIALYADMLIKIGYLAVTSIRPLPLPLPLFVFTLFFWSTTTFQTPNEWLWETMVRPKDVRVKTYPQHKAPDVLLCV